MDIEAARSSLRETVASLDALVVAAEKTKPEAPPRPLSESDISLFAKVMKSVTTFSWKSTISMNEAWRGLVAARKTIVKLADATDDYDEIDTYNKALVIIRDELTRMVNDDWQSRNAVYRPYTEALVKAAGYLKATREKAIQRANSLNLAADVLGAFGKLLGAL